MHVCVYSERPHRYFLHVRGRDVSRLSGAAARREPPVRAIALEHEEALSRGEAQRVPLLGAEGEQRAIHRVTDALRIDINEKTRAQIMRTRGSAKRSPVNTTPVTRPSRKNNRAQIHRNTEMLIEF